MKNNGNIIVPKDFMKTGTGLYINAQGQLTSNATTLQHDEGKMYDDALLQVALGKLNGIEDLRKRGLIKPLGGLGVVLSMYERVNDMTGATFDMDGRTRGENDRLTFDEVGVPVPIIHKEWELGQRYLLASRQRGEAIDTTQMRVASRVVVEGLEDMLFNGVPNFAVAGLSIYGYTTHPKRLLQTPTAAWASTTGANIVTDVQAMLTKLIAVKKYGPYILYVAKNIGVNLESDYSATKGDNTIRDRILRFQDIQEVKVSEYLANGTAVMVQMDSETVDLAVAQDLTNLQWNVHPLTTDFMVFAAMVPRIKYDRNDNCGVIHMS